MLRRFRFDGEPGGFNVLGDEIVILSANGDPRLSIRNNDLPDFARVSIEQLELWANDPNDPLYEVN